MTPVLQPISAHDAAVIQGNLFPVPNAPIQDEQRKRLPMPTEAEIQARAALVAGLRDLAEFFEWHGEVPVPTYPDFVLSVGQCGEWVTDDAEGMARMEIVAAAMGVELERGEHITAECYFSGLRLRAYFIPKGEAASVAPAVPIPANVVGWPIEGRAK